MKATIKRRLKSEAELLDHATNNLLRALKRDMLKKGGRVDREKLRKEREKEERKRRREQRNQGRDDGGGSPARKDV